MNTNPLEAARAVGSEISRNAENKRIEQETLTKAIVETNNTVKLILQEVTEIRKKLLVTQ